MRHMRIMLPLLLLAFMAAAHDGPYQFDSRPGGPRLISPGGTLTAPVLTATAGDSSSTLDWAAVTDATSYTVYRWYDGSETVTEVGTTALLTIDDDPAVNGTPHNYSVKASNADGMSPSSNIARATPRTELVQTMPRYSCIWYTTMPDQPLTSAQLDSLAEYDLITMLDGPFTANDAYVDLIHDLRARNSDIILLSYTKCFNVLKSWGTRDAGDPMKRIYDYCLADTVAYPDRLARWSDDVFGGDQYIAEVGYNDDHDNAYLINVTSPGVADTVAGYWADAMEASDSDGYYTGAFIDVLGRYLPEHICNDNSCSSAIDYDGDGVSYAASGGDEEALLQAHHINFLKALRREFAERDMRNRLLVANTLWAGRINPAAWTSTDSTVYSLLDGFMAEGINLWWPGDEGEDYEYSNILKTTSLLVNSQVDPPVVQVSAIMDSSSQYSNEPMGLAFQGFADAYIDDDYLGVAKRIPYLGQGNVGNHERLPAAGAFVDTSVSGGIITAEYANLTAYIDVTPDTVATTTFIFHNNTTLVTPGDYDVSVTDSLGYATFEMDADSTTIFTNGIYGSLNADYTDGLPMTPGAIDDMSFLSFDIDDALLSSTYGGEYKVVSATLGWHQTIGHVGSATDYMTITGIDAPEILTGLQNMTATPMAADISYSYKDGSTTTVWDTHQSQYSLSDYGAETVNNQDMAIGHHAVDVTDLVLANRDDGLARMAFGIHGYHSAGSAVSRLRAHDCQTAAERPYLVLRVQHNVLPYLVLGATVNDTLSIGGGWPRATP